MARPFRYTFILGLVAAGTALAAVGGWRYARASAPVSGPIILITIDALRADHLPLYGYARVTVKGSGATASCRTVCSCTTRPFTSRSSSNRQRVKAPDTA